MGSMVTDVDARGLVVRDRRRHDHPVRRGTVLWTAGVEAPPSPPRWPTATGAERDRAGRILVEPDLTVPGHPEISVVGDVMSLDELPGVAEVAMQAGLYAGRRIKHQVSGQAARSKPFRYRRPRLGRVHLPRPRGGLGRAAAAVRPPGLAGVAVHPHRVPHRLPQPVRGGPDLGVAFSRGVRRERAFTMQQIETRQDVYKDTTVVLPRQPADVRPTTPT